jgi:hypothetical protein
MPQLEKSLVRRAEAAIEAAQEIDAVPRLRDVLKSEYNERLKGRPRNIALEKRGSVLDKMMRRDWTFLGS